jgi:hypothetical protein
VVTPEPVDLDAIKRLAGRVHEYEYVEPTKAGTAEFVAQVRWDVPALVTEVERLRVALREVGYHRNGGPRHDWQGEVARKALGDHQ